MATELYGYDIYKLSFVPYMRNEKPMSKEMLQRYVDFIYESIGGEMEFITNGEVEVMADKETVKFKNSRLAYTRLQKKKEVRLTEKDTHAVKTEEDYPCINVLFDCSRLDVIFIAIQRKDKFGKTQKTRNGLQQYFDSKLGNWEENSSVEYLVKIDPMHLSKVFWSKIAMLCRNNDEIKRLELIIKDVKKQPLMDVQEPVEQMIASYIAEMRDEMNSSDCNLSFGFSSDQQTDIAAAERSFSKFANYALRNTFEIVAKMKSKKRLSSSKEEPASFHLSKDIVGDSASDDKLISPIKQEERLMAWFNQIYRDLTEIKKVDGGNA